MAADIAPQIDLTARTFPDLRKIGRDFLKQRVGSFKYNSFIATDVAPAIIDVLAWYQEQNSFYYNRKQINSLLILADTREAMSILTQAQGYRMRPATSASVAVQAAPAPPLQVPITLRKGTKVPVSDLTFEIATDTVIPSGKTSWPDGTTDDLIVLTEGSTRTETFVSTGAKFQPFELGQPSTIEGSVSVKVLEEDWQEVASLVFVEGDQKGRDSFTGDGTTSQAFELTLLGAIIDRDDEDALQVYVTPFGGTASDAQRWQQVVAFTGAPKEFILTQTVDGVTTLTFGTDTDGAAPGIGDTIDALYTIIGSQKRYQLTYDSNDRATLRFGDGVFGVIPPTGATITVTYRTGGGVKGNIQAGVIDTQVIGYTPSGQRVNVNIINVEGGRGGEPAETVDHARFFAPKYAKSNVRAVTQGDWTTLAATYFDETFGAPAHATAYLKQKIPELNTVNVAVWGRDDSGQLTTATSALKSGIKNFLDTKRTVCTTAEMVDGDVVFLDIDVDIILQEGKIRQVVFGDVTKAIQKFFSSARVMPGVDVSIGQLYSALQAVEGVSTCEITRIVGAVRVQATVGTGDGVTNLFAGVFALKEGTQLLPQSFSASDGTQQVVDNGEGSLTGDYDSTITAGDPGNAVNYDTGTYSFAFTNVPSIGTIIRAEARLTLYFAKTEDLPLSDGTVEVADGVTQYYPIVRRAPHGIWSGDQRQVIDSFRVGSTSQIRGTLPKGINPGTLSISDLAQTVSDTGGSGVLYDGVTPVGSVNYISGDIDFTFLLAPSGNITATWQTKKVYLQLPADSLPLVPGRLFFWGGFDKDGAQTGAGLYAYDDGDGNILGNLLAGGTVNYDTGIVEFEWNINPPPGIAGGALVTATLTQTPDGSRTEFDFTTGADLSSDGLDGEGRLHLQLSELSQPGVVFSDAYDNWQGKIDSPSLDTTGNNDVVYEFGTGRLTFNTPPAATAPSTFSIQISDVVTFIYAAFVYRVKDPTVAGLEKGLFADNNGRLWGFPGTGPTNLFPEDRLDHLRGRYIAQLQGSPIAEGRQPQLTYDALLGLPPALDIPIAGNQIATSARVTLTEKPPETQAQVV